MKLFNGDLELLDGTKLTIENSIVRKVNNLDVLGLRHLVLSDNEVTQVKSYDSDTIVITTDTRVFDDSEETEKAWSEELGKKVFILPYHYNSNNVFMEMLDKLNKIEKEIENIKKEKEGK